jgi:hypothetical protein
MYSLSARGSGTSYEHVKLRYISPPCETIYILRVCRSGTDRATMWRSGTQDLRYRLIATLLSKANPPRLRPLERWQLSHLRMVDHPCPKTFRRRYTASTLARVCIAR